MSTIVLVLRSGKDFRISDVMLIARHINGKWKAKEHPRIVCLWDKASEVYDLGNITFIPLTNNLPGTWSRMQLYSPEMEKYRPFLYVDLDTAVIESIENIFDLVTDKSQFITLEDFYQKGQLATGLVWFPEKSKKIENVWKEWLKSPVARGNRMDVFLRKCITPDTWWQTLTDSIIDFKPVTKELVRVIPKGANLICFHGKPRIPEATEITWVNEYINYKSK